MVKYKCNFCGKGSMLTQAGLKIHIQLSKAGCQEAMERGMNRLLSPADKAIHPQRQQASSTTSEVDNELSIPADLGNSTMMIFCCFYLLQDMISLLSLRQLRMNMISLNELELKRWKMKRLTRGMQESFQHRWMSWEMPKPSSRKFLTTKGKEMNHHGHLSLTRMSGSWQGDWPRILISELQKSS